MLGSVLIFMMTQNSARAADSGKVKQKASETASAAKTYAADYATETRADFKKSMDSELRGVRQQIEGLQSRATSLTGTARKSMKRQIEELESQRKILAKRLDQTAKTGNSAWTDMSSGLKKAMDELKIGYEKAKASVSGEADEEKTR